MIKNIRKNLWIAAGTICVALGVLGVFVPVLPATPFFLLAAFCYGRGSERFYNWLVYRSWIGSYIRNYRSGQGMPVKQKVLTILFYWLTIGSTIVLVEFDWRLKALLLVGAMVLTVHLVRMKTRPAEVERLQLTESEDDLL
jgi:uncharacterized membrane protein YbaN (DUF454 family)